MKTILLIILVFITSCNRYSNKKVGDFKEVKPLKLSFQTTEPKDTSVAWCDTSKKYLDCSPIRFRINGSWSAVDSLEGKWYDHIDNTISIGIPIILLWSGQPNTEFNAEPITYGDTTTNSSNIECMWSPIKGKFICNNDTPFIWSHIDDDTPKLNPSYYYDEYFEYVKTITNESDGIGFRIDKKLAKKMHRKMKKMKIANK